MKDKITLVIMGRSGSGKGMQAKLLVEKLEPLGVKHLETGQFLRDSLKIENPTTNIAREVMKAGGIFPWWYPVFTWLRVFIEDGAMAYHLVFDGVRKLGEVQLLDEVVSWHGRPLPIGVYINISYKEAERRLLLRQRADDNPQAVANRLAYFEPDVMPSIRHFQDHNRLVEVNGEQTVEAVQEEILNKLKEKLGSLWPLL